MKPEELACILVHVDDMLVAGALSDVMRVKEHLAQSFTIKDLGVACPCTMQANTPEESQSIVHLTCLDSPVLAI